MGASELAVRPDCNIAVTDVGLPPCVCTCNTWRTRQILMMIMLAHNAADEWSTTLRRAQQESVESVGLGCGCTATEQMLQQGTALTAWRMQPAWHMMCRVCLAGHPLGLKPWATQASRSCDARLSALILVVTRAAAVYIYSLYLQQCTGGRPEPSQSSIMVQCVCHR